MYKFTVFDNLNRVKNGNSCFSEITEHVLKVWITQEQLKAAKAKAEELVRAVNLGKPQVVKMTPLPKLSLSEPSPNVSDEVKTLVFSLRPNKAGVTETKEGFVVVVLKQITHPPAKTKEKEISSFKEKLLAQYKNDIFIGYSNALRIRYPVKVNTGAIKALFATE